MKEKTKRWWKAAGVRAVKTVAQTAVATIGTAAAELSDETMKMTIVGVSVVPVLLVYPFLQRFYTKGITVGAVKG